MARPRKRWSYSAGRYGTKVRIYEPKLGAPLRWDYKVSGVRKRPEVTPTMRVRPGVDEPVDVIEAKRAELLCEQKLAELTIAPAPKSRGGIDAANLTVPQAFALFNDPKRGALPKSVSARKHHEYGRRFWESKIGRDERGEPRLWNEVPPADLEGALKKLVEAGQVQTAIKRLQTIRTMTRWLQRKMRIRGLEDPTIGVEVADIKEGYEPRQPRLTLLQTRALRKLVPTLNWRSQLFYTLLIPSGTRAIQARTATRSMLDKPQEPPLPEGYAPDGWIALRPVKGQRSHVTYFTKRGRQVVDAAISGPLAHWEALYVAGKIEDYPLLPSGRVDRDQYDINESVSDRILRYELGNLLKAAGVPNKKGDRLGFHAIRRAWSDFMGDKMGSDAAADAGGWNDPTMLNTVYRSKVRHQHLEEARKIQEQEEEPEKDR